MSVLVAPLETLRSSEPRSSKRLNVLTLAPFFPSVEDPAQGCFIAEPIRRMSAQGIESHVIAVQPFYRGPRRASEAQSEWTTYYALPGNVGLGRPVHCWRGRCAAECANCTHPSQ